MRLPQTGGCQCGAIRYEVSEAPHLVYTCHCTECQRLTGTAFSMALVVAGAAFQLAGTQPRPLQRKADSGRTVTRWVCPDCGTWICSGSKPDPTTRDALRVRAGTLDDTSWLRPTVHFWTRSAQPWVVLPEEDQRFETQPEDLAWMRAGSAGDGRDLSPVGTLDRVMRTTSSAGRTARAVAPGKLSAANDQRSTEP
jgi:hypothetical protein